MKRVLFLCLGLSLLYPISLFAQSTSLGTTCPSPGTTEGTSTLDCGAADANCNGGSGTNGTCTKAAKKQNDNDAKDDWNEKCKEACKTNADGSASGCVPSNSYDTSGDGGLGGTCATRKTPPPATQTYTNTVSKSCHCKKGHLAAEPTSKSNVDIFVFPVE